MSDNCTQTIAIRDHKMTQTDSRFKNNSISKQVFTQTVVPKLIDTASQTDSLKLNVTRKPFKDASNQKASVFNQNIRNSQLNILDESDELPDLNIQDMTKLAKSSNEGLSYRNKNILYKNDLNLNSFLPFEERQIKPTNKFKTNFDRNKSSPIGKAFILFIKIINKIFLNEDYYSAEPILIDESEDDSLKTKRVRFAEKRSEDKSD